MTVTDIIMLDIEYLIEIRDFNYEFLQFSTCNAIMIFTEVCPLSHVYFGEIGAS
jgi:hypothetical protein